MRTEYTQLLTQTAARRADQLSIDGPHLRRPLYSATCNLEPWKMENHIQKFYTRLLLCHVNTPERKLTQ